jgi:adenylate kinase family enzyme
MRITIIGNCGSGKSTLARKISERFDIPHIHLDRFWFEAHGHRLEKGDTAEEEKVRARIRGKVEKAIQEDSWVSDGWYSRVQPLITERADQIVFLDIQLWRRLINHWHRLASNKRHPELSRWNDFKFTFEIVRRTFTHGVQMHQFVQDHPQKVVHLRSHKEVDKYLANLPAL